MFCIKCGKQIGDNAKFCPFCGQKVSAAAAAAASGSGETAAGVQKPTENLRKKGLIAAAVIAAVIVAAAAVIAGVKLSAAKRAEAAREEERRAERDSEKKKDKSADNADKKAKEDDAAQAAEQTDEAEAVREAEQADEEIAAAEADALSEEVLNVLSAYQAYVDGWENGALDGCVLAYLDEDDIPELIVIGSYEAAGQVIVTYNDGELKENYISRLGGLSYVEKKNFYHNSNGHMGFYYDEFFCLEDGEQKTLALGEYGDVYDDAGNIVWNEAGDYPEQKYAWNGADCSEEEYYENVESYVNQMAKDEEFIHVDGYGSDVYFDMQEAYQNIGLRTYGAYWPQVVEFDLKDGVLTFTTDDGARYGWGSGGDTSTVSYPVAQDCIWENRSVGWENKYPQVGYTEYLNDTTYEEIRKWLDEEKRFYAEAVAEYGEDAAEVNSPLSINLVVKDGVVIRVYTVIS